MSTSKKSKLITLSLWAAVILWLALIFSLSAQPAVQSKGLSEKVIETIITAVAWTVHADMDAKTMSGLVKQFHHVVRKLAHGWIYFVLGILVITTLIKTGIRGFKAYALATLFCISYAAIDEMHQTFVPGRGGQLADILIDAVGAVLGIGVYWVHSRCVKRDGSFRVQSEVLCGERLTKQ